MTRTIRARPVCSSSHRFQGSRLHHHNRTGNTGRRSSSTLDSCQPGGVHPGITAGRGQLCACSQAGWSHRSFLRLDDALPATPQLRLSVVDGPKLARGGEPARRARFRSRTATTPPERSFPTTIQSPPGRNSWHEQQRVKWGSVRLAVARRVPTTQAAPCLECTRSAGTCPAVAWTVQRSLRRGRATRIESLRHCRLSPDENDPVARLHGTKVHRAGTSPG